VIGYEPSDHVFIGDKVESGIVEIDALGERCPIPVQRVRRALRNCPEGSTIVLVGDDPESIHDIPALMKRLGLVEPEITESSEIWTYQIRNITKQED